LTFRDSFCDKLPNETPKFDACSPLDENVHHIDLPLGSPNAGTNNFRYFGSLNSPSTVRRDDETAIFNATPYIPAGALGRKDFINVQVVAMRKRPEPPGVNRATSHS
jgi:hypothetical protein